MADSPREHRVDIRSSSLESFRRSSPSNFPEMNGTGSLDNHDKNISTPPSKSRRTLRQSKTMPPERKAYPLPDPSQFETPNNEILYPKQTLLRINTIEQQKFQEEDVLGDKQPSRKQLSSISENDKQPAPSIRKDPEEAKILKSPGSNAVEIELVPPQQEEEVVVKEDEGLESTKSIVKSSSKVLVVYDGEKKFTTAPLDIALNEYATSEGDAILVVAFLEHIMSPMGMKMVADLKQFSGVNESILQQSVFLKKNDLESKFRDTSRLRVCQMKKIQLDVKVVPGSNHKALVAKEIIAFDATCVIFDKNAMKNRKYYEENLSCRILRLRSDGRRVETISLFGQGLEKTGSLTSHCSDSSSDSSMNSEMTIAPSAWSKLKLFGSKRSTGPLHHSHGGKGSLTGSSRTNSNLGSPRPSVQEEEGTVAEALEESFSFDSPKPNPTEAYVYAAAGLEKFSPYSRRNGETLPKALAA